MGPVTTMHTATTTGARTSTGTMRTGTITRTTLAIMSTITPAITRTASHEAAADRPDLRKEDS